MQIRFFSLFAPSILSLILAGWLFPTQAQSVPYRTSFEEPEFTVGNVGGQNDWQEISGTGAGAVQMAVASGIKRGTQSLKIQSGSTVGRDFSSAATRVYIDGYYRGPTVAQITEATSITDVGTSLVLFHETEGIMALNGNGSGGGTWQTTGVSVVTDTLQRITILQHYDTQTWDLYVDEMLELSGLGFKDNSITQLNGINIETSDSGEGYLDDFAITTDPPDFLAEPILFYMQAEWGENGGGDFNWDIFPLSRDGNVGPGDLLELMNRILE